MMGGMPDFLIIGASRGGTSSLFKNLLQHPQIAAPSYKEVHFFNSNERYGYGIEWYKKQFPKVKKNGLLFEASPAYFTTPMSVERIYKHLPNCKFILLLRNPVDRALSFYARWDEICNPRELMAENPHHGIVETGIYEKGLRRWFNYFPRNRFLIIKSEDFFEDEKKIITQCFNWLNIEPIDIGDPLFFDQRGVKTEWHPYQKEAPDDVKEYLKKLFRSYNISLYNFLDRDFNWQ